MSKKILIIIILKIPYIKRIDNFNFLIFFDSILRVHSLTPKKNF